MIYDFKILTKIHELYAFLLLKFVFAHFYYLEP